MKTGILLEGYRFFHEVIMSTNLRHMKRLEAVPGLEGMHPEGPGSADAERFLARAYPDTDIPLSSIEAARRAAAALRGRPFPKGKGRPGTWVTIGPSNAFMAA